MYRAADGRFMSFFGDLHPSFAGNVVKAMGGAKQGYPVLTRTLEKLPPSARTPAEILAEANDQWRARVVRVDRLTPTIVEVVVEAPAAARRGGRRLDHDLDDGRRQPVDADNARAPLVVGLGQDLGRRAGRRRQLLQGARQHRIALLGAAHRLHDVAGEGRMQVAEERHEAAVSGAIHQHTHLGGLGHPLRRGGMALLVERAEILAVDEGVRRVLARQHGVGLRARGHQDVRAGKVASTFWPFCSPATLRALAWPVASTSTATGDRPSAKRMSSSSAFSTSSC